MSGRPREIVKKQIEQIGDLYFNKKLHLWQIAEMLDINQTTVFENVAKYRKWIKDSINFEKLAEQHLIENISNKRKVMQRAWVDYGECKKEFVKVKLLELISKTEDDILSLFERLKLIDKPAEKLDVTYKQFQEDLNWAQQFYVKKRQQKASLDTQQS